jgi:tRNA(Ile)-lysidine synthase
VDFLKNNHRVSVVFVHHGTEASDLGMRTVMEYAALHDVPVMVNYISTNKPSELSQEEFWRHQRYDFFDSLNNDWPVVTAHHLDDCVETYVWSMCHGTGKVVPYRRGRVLRPFLLNTKQELQNWAERRSLTWHDDASNADVKYTRNLVRHEVVPQILRVNPGIHQVVRRIVNDNFSLDKHQY